MDECNLAEGARVHRSRQHPEQVGSGELARHGRGQGCAGGVGASRLTGGARFTAYRREGARARPPNLEQTEKIRKQRSRDPDQFWHLLAGPPALQGANVLAHGLARPRDGRSALPVEARWFRERLDRMRGEQLLQIVRTLDNQMNNTSLILLFEVGGKKLLFPGDAQIENWSYALQEAENAEKTRALLADVDVYKVGHHGSLNATPKKLLWENFTKKGTAKRLRTLLSTLPGKHGKVASKTEVPRRPLLEALEQETTLLNTHDYPLGQNIRLSEKIIVKVS